MMDFRAMASNIGQGHMKYVDPSWSQPLQLEGATDYLHKLANHPIAVGSSITEQPQLALDAAMEAADQKAKEKAAALQAKRDACFEAPAVIGVLTIRRHQKMPSMVGSNEGGIGGDATQTVATLSQMSKTAQPKRIPCLSSVSRCLHR